MAIPFNPPEGLINEYLNRKQPAEIANEGIQQALQIYAAMKQQHEQKAFQQKVLDSQDAQRKAGEFKAVADYVSEAQIPGLARQYGINIPGDPALAAPTQPDANYSSQAGGDQAVTPSGSPILSHWNATMGQGQGQPSQPGMAPGMPPLGPRPTSKHGLEKYQKNLAMTKTEGEMAPKMPITKEDLMASGKPFDPMNQMIVEPPNNDAKDQKYANEQDRLEAQAIDRLSKLRGDQSLARVENQRDAATQAYNTIDRIKNEGRAPSKLEYYDILGQMWKARTGASPTDQALRDLDQKTFKGDLGKAYTYFSGKVGGATTTEVLQNLQDFATDSGLQADKFHSSYMDSHKLKPSGLEESRWQPIFNSHRGMSFQDATGYKPKASGLDSTPTTEGGYSYAPGPGGRANKDNWKKS